jgi:hypothetical protein
MDFPGGVDRAVRIESAFARNAAYNGGISSGCAGSSDFACAAGCAGGSADSAPARCASALATFSAPKHDLAATITTACAGVASTRAASARRDINAAEHIRDVADETTGACAFRATERICDRASARGGLRAATRVSGTRAACSIAARPCGAIGRTGRGYADALAFVRTRRGFGRYLERIERDGDRLLFRRKQSHGQSSRPEIHEREPRDAEREREPV